MYQVFINLQYHLHFFLHFVFSFMGKLFMDDPISHIIEPKQRLWIMHGAQLHNLFKFKPPNKIFGTRWGTRSDKEILSAVRMRKPEYL